MAVCNVHNITYYRKKIIMLVAMTLTMGLLQNVVQVSLGNLLDNKTRPDSPKSSQRFFLVLYSVFWNLVLILGSLNKSENANNSREIKMYENEYLNQNFTFYNARHILWQQGNNSWTTLAMTKKFHKTCKMENWNSESFRAIVIPNCFPA